MKQTISKITFDENSKEQIPLIINSINVGTYSLGIYSKWYSQRLDKGERTIPNVGKFVSGLLLKEYGIDTRDWNDSVQENEALKIALQKMNCTSIGEWFESFMIHEMEKKKDEFKEEVNQDINPEENVDSKIESSERYVEISSGLRCLAIAVTGFLAWFTLNMERVFDYKSDWSRIMNRGEITNQFDQNMKALLLIGLLGAILWYIKSFITRFYEERIMIDFVADFAVIVSVILDILLTKYLYRANVPMEKTGPRVFLIVSSVMVLITIAHFIIGVKHKKIIREDGPISDLVMASKKNTSMKISKILCIVYVVLMMFPVVNSFILYSKFLPNYGIMGKQPLVYAEEMMNDYMNFYYNGVSVGEDLYYIPEAGPREIYVYHGDATEPELFWESETFYSCITADETYLYIEGFSTTSSNKYVSTIGRIKIATGEYEELFSSDEMNIHGIAVRDGVLYYYADGEKQVAIYCIQISDNMDFANAKVYVGALKDLYLAFIPDATLYLSYVSGYPDFFADGHFGFELGLGALQTKHGEYFYNIADENANKMNFHSLYMTPASLVRYQEGEEYTAILENAIAENVTAYNWHNDLLYFAVATEEGYEIYESEPDGSNRRVIVSSQDGTRVQDLFTTENAIIFSYSNSYDPDVEERISGSNRICY